MLGMGDIVGTWAVFRTSSTNPRAQISQRRHRREGLDLAVEHVAYIAADARHLPDRTVSVAVEGDRQTDHRNRETVRVARIVRRRSRTGQSSGCASTPITKVTSPSRQTQLRLHDTSTSGISPVLNASCKRCSIQLVHQQIMRSPTQSQLQMRRPAAP